MKKDGKKKREAISKKIKQEVDKGHPQKQAVAIAFSEEKKKKPRRSACG